MLYNQASFTEVRGTLKHEGFYDGGAHKSAELLSQLAKANRDCDRPLPPPGPELKMATASAFIHETPDSFKPLPGGGLLLRESEIAKLSGGAVGARVFRATGTGAHGIPWHYHEIGMHFGYVTRGWAIFEFEGVGRVKVEKGTFMYQPPMNRHRELEASPDFEAIEITFAAHNKNTFLIPAEEGGFQKVSVDIA